MTTLLGSWIRWVRLSVLILILTAMALPSLATPPSEKVDPFASFTPFIGQTWKGEGKDAAGKTLTDIARWEWALGGKAVRIVHMLADASYGGETMIFWDAAKKNLIYHYFTTAGFHTQGVMVTQGPGKITAEEEVTGHPSVRKVRSTMMAVDGKLAVQSEFLANDQWSFGHSFSYTPTSPDALPAFPQAR
jgi:hypothetical protein